MFLRFLLLFTLLSQVAFSQTKSRKALKLFEEAQRQYRYNQYQEAINLLEQALHFDDKFQNAYIFLGDIFRKTERSQQAIVQYQKAIDLGISDSANLYYVLAETELSVGNYTNAKTHFTTFLNNAKADKKYLDKAAKYLENCAFALQALEKPLPYKPINLGANINSAYKEYFPALTADEQQIIFTRNIDGNEDFFVARRVANNWTKAQPLSNNINTKNFNEGAQSLSPDGRYLFYTGCNRPDGFGRCDIYLSVKQGKDWSKPVNLGPIINSSYWESQPSISADGQTLYFLSNRPGGYGGYDIWKSVLGHDGNWQTPVNLGPNINTAEDEATPFIHADGTTLYFASEGWTGMGGKDIFVSKMDINGNFSKAVNLGYPINTYKDEFGLIVSTDGQKGLFSSNLNEGFGDVDIYEFEMPQQLKPLTAIFVKGTVRDKENLKAIEGNVSIYNLSNRQLKYQDYSDPIDGSFMAVMPSGEPYAFNILAKGYMIYSLHFDLQVDSNIRSQEFDIQLDRIANGKKVTLKNIFFDTNKYELLPSSLSELKLLSIFMAENPSVEIEIQGHTDSIGSEKDNQILSENRAKAVYTHLLTLGVNAKRLLYKGYGENKPATSNATAAGRQLNRRTEFLVTKH